jgi:predicted nucleotidyltransferase
MRKKALGDKLPALLDYFASNESINTVYLFGSFGTPHYVISLSDIDMAVLFGGNIPLMQELKINADISMILQRDDVDVINLNTARVDLGHEILCTGEIIYDKNKIRTADFVEQTLKHYFDYGIPLKRMKEEFIETLKGEIVSDG